LYTLLGEWVGPEQIEEVARGLRGRKVREVMRYPVVSVEAETSVEDLVETMIWHQVHRLSVTWGNEVVGEVSRHDLLKLFARGLTFG
jgi:CBS domain-containing protein